MDAQGRTAHSPWRMPLAAWRQVAVRSWNEATTDNIGLVSAGVAFYGFLAVLPALAATILTYGLFVAPRTVIGHMQELTHVLPEAAAIAIGEQLLQLSASPDERKGLGVLLSLAVALFGARNGAGAIITALNIAYEEDEKRGFFRLALIALALTAAAVFAAIAVAVAIAMVASIDARMGEVSAGARIIGAVLTYGLLALAGAGAAAVLYRFGPSRHAAKWIWLSPGSIFSALGWLVLTFGFGAYAKYIGKFDATYGSLGAIVALLTWLYLASYVLLLGAELNSELEHQTATDTTRGPQKPLGARRAWVADHVAGAVSNDGGPAPAATAEASAPPSPTPLPAVERSSEPQVRPIGVTTVALSVIAAMLTVRRLMGPTVRR